MMGGLCSSNKECKKRLYNIDIFEWNWKNEGKVEDAGKRYIRNVSKYLPVRWHLISEANIWLEMILGGREWDETGLGYCSVMFFVTDNVKISRRTCNMNSNKTWHFDFIAVGKSVCRIRTGVTQPQTGMNTRGRERCLKSW
jgi:hypothetical protein